jgi:hypothetical protein
MRTRSASTTLTVLRDSGPGETAVAARAGR